MTVNMTGTAVGTTLKLAAGAALVVGGSVAGAGYGSAVAQVPSEVDSIPSGPGADAGAQPVGYTKVWKHTWRNAPSYYDDEHGLNPVGKDGVLFAGSNYFYCQKRSDSHTYGKYKNNWWLKTDDDKGNASVWISAVYVSGGANWEKIPGVKKC